MARFWESLTQAIKSVVKPLRPANIAGPLLTTQYMVSGYDPRVADEKAQQARVSAYEEWQRQGSRRGIWTNYVAFNQLASGQWIPVVSSNVSAIRWTPLGTNYNGSQITPTEELLQERRLRTSGGRPTNVDVGVGQSSPFVDIRGVRVDVRDTSRIRTLLTPAEFREYQNRMLEPVKPRQAEIKSDTRGIRRIAPTAKGKRITADTPGIFFARFLKPVRVYMYPSTTLSEALDFYQAASKGHAIWVQFRWAGKPYEQISGPPVKFRMGAGR